MILIIQYKSELHGEYLNYSGVELPTDFEKVALLLREAIDESAEENYGQGYIYLEFYRYGKELECVNPSHKYVHTAIPVIMSMMEKYP